MNYVQQELFWVSLMAMPSNPTFFCSAATYDTLSCPTNFKRWRKTTDARCTLMYYCMYFRSLQSITRARENDYTVLCNVIKSSKIFILNIKEAVRIFDKSSMFVKKGVKLPCNRTAPLGILH